MIIVWIWNPLPSPGRSLQTMRQSLASECRSRRQSLWDVLFIATSCFVLHNWVHMIWTLPDYPTPAPGHGRLIMLKEKNKSNLPISCFCQICWAQWQKKSDKQ